MSQTPSTDDAMQQKLTSNKEFLPNDYGFCQMLEKYGFCRQKLFLLRQFFHRKTFFSTQWQKLANPCVCFRDVSV